MKTTIDDENDLLAHSGQRETNLGQICDVR